MAFARVFSAAAVIFSGLSFTLAADVCNGQAAYCSRSYSNLTFVGAHDSAFSLLSGDDPADNQNIAVSDILGLGVRYLQGQTHKNALGSLDLCHTSCLELDAGSLESFLGTVKSFLDSNANEVVTLLLTNGDNLDVTEFGTAFSDAGIDSYAYVPTGNPMAIGDWPTLGDLIDSGKRLVVFLDYGADTTKVDYILDEFAYCFETQFDVTDSTFSNCSIDRPAGASADGRMYIVNHFLDVNVAGILIPDRGAASTTNAAQGTGSIGAQADLCEGLYARAPNVVLLDWIDVGDAMTAQAALNGVS